MSGRPRGRPRKDASAVSTPVAKPKAAESEVDGEEERDAEMEAPSTSSSLRRSSPRKRKPPNFADFIVETPGLGIVGEGAEIIQEIEQEDPIEVDIKTEVDDGTYTPGVPPPSTKRKYTKRKKLNVDDAGRGDLDTSLVRIDDIEEELDNDPMRRVERRGRKKKKVDGQITVTPKFVGLPKLVKEATLSACNAKSEEAETVEEQEMKPSKELLETAGASSPSKSPHRSPSKIATTHSTPSKSTGVARRKQEVAVDGDEEEYGPSEEIVVEEVPEEMIEEDLVDVESFEVPMPIRMPIERDRYQERLHNKPFRCTDCGAGYRREAYLLNHLANVHQDECAILSAAERSAKRASRRPERMIPKERPGEAAYKFGCDLCERRFLRWEGLVVHQKQIHKEVTQPAKDQEKNRDYGAKCPVCLLYFFGNHALSEHVSKVHPNHNRFIFACDICGMGFMHWARVRAHKTQIHNAPVKYTQGYLKKNPEMAKIVEAQRMRKAVERNRAKRMLEKGILSTDVMGRDYSGLSRSEMNEYMYLMPPTLEPEMEGDFVGEMYEDDQEEIVEEEGIIDPSEMMNIRMVPLPPSSIRRPPLPPRMMGYRNEGGIHYREPRGYNPRLAYPRGSHHQLAALHHRVTQLDRRDLEILNRRLPPGVGGSTVIVKEEDDDEDVDVERDEEMIEEEVVDDEMIMDEVDGMGEEGEEGEEEDTREEGEVEEEEDEDDDGEVEPPPQLDMYEHA